jgi:hypothetical protein
VRKRLTPLLLAALALLPVVALAAERRNTTTRAAPRAAAAPPNAAASAKSPLDHALSARERAAYLAATGTLARFEYSDALPLTKGIPPVRAACARLNRQQPLLAALRTTCTPAIRINQRARAARATCRGRETAPACITALRARADTTRDVATAQRAYARAVRRTIPPGACRAALAPIHDVVAAWNAYADATDELAHARATNDAVLARVAQQRLDRHAETINDDLVYLRTNEITDACNLPTWSLDAA